MAVFCKELNLLFIECPRTGCTSIAKFFKKNYDGISCTKHSKVEESLKYFNLEKDKVFKVCGVRNPFSSLHSLYYKALARSLVINKDFLPAWGRRQVVKIKDCDYNFKNFIKIYSKVPKLYLSYQQGLVDDVIRFEDLENELNRILKIAGVDNIFKLTQVNKTVNKTTHYREMFDYELFNIIYKENKEYCDFYSYIPPTKAQIFL